LSIEEPRPTGHPENSGYLQPGIEPFGRATNIARRLYPGAFNLETNTASALLAALRPAREHGTAEAALRSSGIVLSATERFAGLSGEIREVLGDSGADHSIEEALALGFLAGRAATRPRMRTPGDPTSFVMDRDLVVQGAEGESILRLPWFDADMFVGRQLSDIREMPRPVRSLCVKHYSAALAGEPSVPLHELRALLLGRGAARAGRRRRDRGGARGRLTVQSIRLRCRRIRANGEASRSLRCARGPARRHAPLGRARRRGANRTARRRKGAGYGSERNRENAGRLRARDTPDRCSELPSLTHRETEAIQLASHGLTYSAIAEQLAVSEATIKTHMENAYPKLGVIDKAAAVATALRHGLIE
jgi:DNA-binding CsgD family transcriptional regulator